MRQGTGRPVRAAGRGDALPDRRLGLEADVETHEAPSAADVLGDRLEHPLKHAHVVGVPDAVEVGMGRTAKRSERTVSTGAAGGA